MRVRFVPRGLWGLIFWLFLGFCFTEVMVLSVNAWLLHEPHATQVDLMSEVKVDLPHD